MSKAKKFSVTYESSSPVTAAAKESLKQRLKAAWRYAPKAAKRANEDIEYVHQLRVSVRRANAAIELYASLLSRKQRRLVNKQLRALRKAAGQARDLDILQLRLLKLDPQSSSKEFGALLDFVKSQRKRAQREIKRGYAKAKQQNFQANAKRLLKSVKWRGEGEQPDFGTFARTAFEPMVERFFAAAAVDMSDIEMLHQLRIEGKNIRYAIDLLSPAFCGKFTKQNTATFVVLQDKLGTINDHASAIAFYQGLLKTKGARDCKSAIKEMIEFEKKELEATRADFASWWSDQRVAEMRKQFTMVLSENGADENTAANSDAPAGDAAGTEAATAN
ncbi:MAG: CHAD domain-containing protein [Rhodopirellula sp. JB044]|uniref:CHAD domain-containing protein n=1 Tax=Rhodopirellula sp. JB044 TaxID=3342844 RepID=UPI00370C10AF